MYSTSELNVLNFCYVGFSVPVLSTVKINTTVSYPTPEYNIKDTLHLTPGDTGVQTHKKLALTL